MSTNLHIFLSPFTHESRALKQTKSLIEASLFDEVVVAAVLKDELKEKESIDEYRHVWRVSLTTKRLPKIKIINQLKYAEWIIRMMWGMRGKKISVVESHSIPALLPGVLFKLFWRTKLVYDAHELETEILCLHGFRQRIYKILERYLIKFVDATIVVSDSIADWYKDNYSIDRPFVVRNVPYNYTLDSQSENTSSLNVCCNLKSKFNISDEQILFIYQGGISQGRGIEIMLNAFSKANPDKHIVFMGYGELVETVKEYEKKFSNIHFHPAVKPEELLYFTQSADIGLVLTENTCLSHYFSLPNKIFEYILSGLPVIASDFPEIGKIISDRDCGWKINVEENNLCLLVNSITLETLAIRKQKAVLAKDKFGWQIEEKEFLSIYRKLEFSQKSNL